jgi:hypothetical protein
MNGEKNYRKRLEEIFLSISFGIAEANEYKYILSIKRKDGFVGIKKNELDLLVEMWLHIKSQVIPGK